MPMTSSAGDPVELLRELVAIDSVNPDLVPGGAGESAAADLCASWLTGRRFEVQRLEERAGRPSVVGIRRGTGGGRSIMLNGHLDTVSTATYDGAALEPRIDGDRMYGRGTYDMKGGLAAMLVAADRATTNARLRGDVVVACVADEEFASHGTADVLRHVRTDVAIVTEPNGLEVTVAHKGFAWFDIEVAGVGAHGSRPDLGVDAIAKAGHVLVAIDELAARLAEQPAHSLVGRPSIHASLIHGGDEASTYPSSCRITVERRTVPGETIDSVTSEIQELIDETAARVAGLDCRVTTTLHRDPFEADAESSIVQTISRAVERRLGRPAALRGEAYWTDCALLAGAGIETALIGAAGGGAHAATEWIEIPSLLALTDILTEVVTATTA
jgi:acetylornithine deacetylase